MTTLRIDKLLWFLRLVKHREGAQDIVAQGHVRLNGARVTRNAQAVTTGDRVVLPLGMRICAIEIVTLPSRRGPAPEAAACYRVLDEPPAYPIAAPHPDAAHTEDLQP